MTYPRGTLIRNATATRINHWITAGCFVLLLLSGLSMFHPLLFWLSELFGGGQWTRAVHPWIGVVLLLLVLGIEYSAQELVTNLRTHASTGVAATGFGAITRATGRRRRRKREFPFARARRSRRRRSRSTPAFR